MGDRVKVLEENNRELQKKLFATEKKLHLEKQENIKIKISQLDKEILEKERDKTRKENRKLKQMLIEQKTQLDEDLKVKKEYEKERDMTRKENGKLKQMLIEQKNKLDEDLKVKKEYE